jgi:hypothetical protein
VADRVALGSGRIPQDQGLSRPKGAGYTTVSPWSYANATEPGAGARGKGASAAWASAGHMAHMTSLGGARPG